MDIYQGSVVGDDRGLVTFFNFFNFNDVKRFYIVQNHKAGFVRAWHGHLHEGKYVYVIRGAILLGIRPINGEIEPEKVNLTAAVPQIYFIPPGNYNGFKTLTDDTQVIFFSTSTLEESKADDLREPARRWDVWEENWR